MIVVSDTSPLNYLVLIGAIDVLPQLFGRVCVPEVVLAELRDPATPAAVRAWTQSPPGWILAQAPSNPGDPALAKLHPGERHAIALARELHADHLLIDERRGRRVAADLGVPVIGLLGVLDLAAAAKLINLRETIMALAQTSFRVDPALVDMLLERDARRMAGP
jgi:predicted nucleic acid-binding protein